MKINKLFVFTVLAISMIAANDIQAEINKASGIGFTDGKSLSVGWVERGGKKIAALERLNYLTYLIDWGGSTPNAEVPNAVGTKVDLSAFEADAADPAKLVDRLSGLALGRKLATAPRDKVIAAVSWWTSTNDSANWKANRVKAAAFLVFGSPDYQVLR